MWHGVAAAGVLSKVTPTLAAAGGWVLATKFIGLTVIKQSGTTTTLRLSLCDKTIRWHLRIQSTS